MITCLVDQTKHESIEALHVHLRRFKIRQADYYTEYHKKVDKLTGQPIPFKDYAQYMSQDFVDKRHMKKWLKENPEEGKEWALEYIRRRKQDKELVYTPSQVELKSLGGPDMGYYESVGGYYEIVGQLGFKERYVNVTPRFVPLAKDARIIEDTREQIPLKLPFQVISAKVDAGDYALAKPYDKGIYIERKGLSDLVSTLSARKISRKSGDDSNLARFDRELERATGQDHYIVMLVESSLTEALSFNYLPQMRWSKVAPSHIFHNLRALLNKYPLNFQVVFAEGRIDAACKLIKIFELGEQVRKLDLQWLAERGVLCG